MRGEMDKREIREIEKEHLLCISISLRPPSRSRERGEKV